MENCIGQEFAISDGNPFEILIQSHFENIH